MTVESVKDAICKLRDLASKTSITLFLSDWKLQAAVMWLLYTAIQGCIELAVKLIFAMGLKSAESYSSAFETLYEAKILTSEESKRFSNIVEFRDTLSYNEVNLELIYDRLHNVLPDIEACCTKLATELTKYNVAIK
nr:DUF86 domain-containing protein [Candidatus Njordarchaeota archaeon]